MAKKGLLIAILPKRGGARPAGPAPWESSSKGTADSPASPSSAEPEPLPEGSDSPDEDDSDPSRVRPEDVDYHDDSCACELCEYMQHDGTCRVLRMPVPPRGWCRRFEPKDESQESQESQEAPDSDDYTQPK